MSHDRREWHRHFILFGILELVDQHGRADTTELVICETVERRRATTPYSSCWQYRWPA